MFVRVNDSMGSVRGVQAALVLPGRRRPAVRAVRVAAVALLLLLCTAVASFAAAPTDHEQYMLQLINRARNDPAGEAARFGMGLNDDISSSNQISTDPKPPLAMNDLLIDSARQHSDWMLAEDLFAHEGEGGSDPGMRMAEAGYNVTWYWGENLAWQGTPAPLDSRRIMVMVEDAHRLLFESPDHRLNTMKVGYREVGVGIMTGKFLYDAPPRPDGYDPPPFDYNTAMVTQNFARESGIYCLTGVAFDDIDGNQFYSPGEGFGGVRISAIPHDGGSPIQTTTWGTGGFALDLPNGTYDVVAQGDEIGFHWISDVLMANSNVELNFVPEPGGSARAAALALSLLILRRRGRH